MKYECLSEIMINIKKIIYSTRHGNPVDKQVDEKRELK